MRRANKVVFAFTKEKKCTPYVAEAISLCCFALLYLAGACIPQNTAFLPTPQHFKKNILHTFAHMSPPSSCMAKEGTEPSFLTLSQHALFFLVILIRAVVPRAAKVEGAGEGASLSPGSLGCFLKQLGVGV